MSSRVCGGTLGPSGGRMHRRRVYRVRLHQTASGSARSSGCRRRTGRGSCRELYRALRSWKSAAVRISEKTPNGLQPDQEDEVVFTEVVLTSGETTVGSLVSSWMARRSEGTSLAGLTLTLPEGAPLDLQASAGLLDGQEVVLRRSPPPLSLLEEKNRYALVMDLCREEEDFSRTLAGVAHLYREPLRKLVSEADHHLLFEWIGPMLSISQMVASKLRYQLANWDPDLSRPGSVFTKHLWLQYEDFQDRTFPQALAFLRSCWWSGDGSLGALCALHQGPSLHSLPDLYRLPLERLSQYEVSLGRLLAETSEQHPDAHDLRKAARNADTMVRRGSSERQGSELDRIQDLFPHDSLRLHELDPLARRGLLRSRSAATLKLQRALLSGPSTNLNGGRHVTTRRQVSAPSGVPPRTFLLEAPVRLTTGVQSQERHLFLFHDLLLVAKPRSSSGGGQFKLKEKVLVCELWISETGVEDVAELPQHKDTSFVIGWPTTNHVATFNSSRTKELWRSKLEQLLLEAKEREGLVTTTLPVTYLDTSQRQEYPKLVKVTNTQTTSDLIQVLLRQLCLQETERSEYQLWVKTGKDDSPYPLIGHEFPFSIKMNLIRDLLQRSELDLRRLSSLSTDAKCTFVLRRHSYDVSTTSPLSEKKSRNGRRTTGLVWPFFRSRTHAVTKVSLEEQHSASLPLDSSSSGHFFGQPLDCLIKNGQLPVPLQCILRRLYCKGPRTMGIFRKSGNVRLCRELKERIEAQDEINWDSLPVVTLASILKEFLRCLPDCLLQSFLYEEWLEGINRDSQLQRRKHIITVLSRLPASNRLVLVHLLCLLNRISQDAPKNKMSAENLAVCIGPSLLSPASSLSPCLHSNDVSKKVPKLVTFLIEDWCSLFGEEPLQLFSGIECTHDSGAEDSDSIPEHSGTFPSSPRDDSSLDSLEEEETIAPSNCAKVSLTNLSHDSGLTLSDTQLYTPEEDMGLEDSGCVVSPHRAKSVPYHLDRPEEHQTSEQDLKVQHYNGLPCHRERMQHGRSKMKDNSIDHRREPSQRLRRSASEESLLEKYMVGSGMGTLSSQHHRPVAHHKGRAPSPPASSFRSPHNGHMDNQAVWFARHSGHMDWNRSQSTSKIDGMDLPQVSRSVNSEQIAHSCADIHVYENLPTGISSPVYGTNFPPFEPPSYDEALTRRNLLRRLQTPPNAAPVTDQMRQEQTTLSAKARQLYEESLRLYNGDKTHHAVPVQVKEDRLRHLPPVHVTEAQIACSRPAHRVVACQRTWKPSPDIPDDLQGGIHWSVAQLRTLFNNTVNNGRRQLPPYRHPPPCPRPQEESFV